MKKIKIFIDEVIVEMTKVVWPKPSVVRTATALVISISLIFGVLLGMFDRLIALILHWFFVKL